MASGDGTSTSPPKIMEFRPTMKEFESFSEYIAYMEDKEAHKAGLAKIIPPKEWRPRKSGYGDIDELAIPTPISRGFTGSHGYHTQSSCERETMTVKEFRRLAYSDSYKTPFSFDAEHLEKKYWNSLNKDPPPVYGTNVSASLYDEDVKEWNLNKLNTILDCVSENYGMTIEGVNKANLHFGMWRTGFAWHTELLDLYSVNYLHFGAAKTWYAIPPSQGKRFESFASGCFPREYQLCEAFLKHKKHFFAPFVLDEFSIPYDKVIQKAGEFIVTFPSGYHTGYDHGFNCSEETNFASHGWIDCGKIASRCFCFPREARMSMVPFVKHFQPPERYDLWLNSKDKCCHPATGKKYRAASPSKSDLMEYKRLERERRDGQTAVSIAVEELVEDQGSLLECVGPKDVECEDVEYKSKSLNQPGMLGECSSTDKASGSGSAKIGECSTSLPSIQVAVTSERANYYITCNESEKQKQQAIPKFSLNCSGVNNSPKFTIGEIMEDWAKPLTKLWQHKEKDFDEETNYNEAISKAFPYCCVCSYFKSKKKSLEDDKECRPSSSKVAIPEIALGRIYSDPFQKAILVDEQGESALLVCEACKICIHASCYGVAALPKSNEGWRCSRCIREDLSAECRLCRLRGGALQPASDGSWSHIVCALLVEDPSLKKLAIVLSRRRPPAKCWFCLYLPGLDGVRGGYVSCLGKINCKFSFHVTCAYSAGILFDVVPRLNPFYVACLKHSKCEDENNRYVANIKTKPPVSI